MQSDLIRGTDEMLKGDIGDAFVYDPQLAAKERRVVLCYRATNVPIPMNFPLSEVGMKTDKFSWREVHRAVKNCLPDNIVRQRASEANTLIRGIGHRSLKDSTRDFEKWKEKTQKSLADIYGHVRANTFMADVKLPSNIPSGTPQALRFYFEAALDSLKNF